MTQSREAFEATVRDYMYMFKKPDGKYLFPETNWAWKAWQAAEAHGMEKAAVICDKEATDHMQGASKGGSSRSDYAAEACRDCASEIRDAIRAAKETT